LAVEVAPPLSSAASALTSQNTDPQPGPGQTLSDAGASSDSGRDPSEAGLNSTDPLAQPTPRLSPQDSVDFLLYPAELAKGRRAAENYLSSFRSDDGRKIAEEALVTLATVISGGKCDSVEFPWQQIRPYHGAAALTILKEKGAPARIEALRCRADTTRGYRVVPDAYPPRQVQKIRSTLSKVIEECCELGFVSDEEREGRITATKSDLKQPAKGKTSKRATTKTPTKKKSSAPAGRLLGDGELRALVAASAADANAEGYRDAIFFSLVYRGLKIAEITGLTPDSVRFSNKTGECSIVARPSRGGGRGRKVQLTNEELICLEDWLECRGDGPGPLLGTVGRASKFEGKRLTTAVLKEICLNRGKQAEVPEFVPKDLSRSADFLTEHRKSARRKAARAASETLSTAEKALYLTPGDSDSDPAMEAIQFPFLGLST